MKRLSGIISWVIVLAGIVLAMLSGKISETAGVNDVAMIALLAITSGLSCYFFYVSHDRLAKPSNFIKKTFRIFCGALAIILAISTSIATLFFMISEGKLETTNILAYAFRLCWMFLGISCWIIYKILEKKGVDMDGGLYHFVSLIAIAVAYALACIISAFRTITFNVFGSYTLTDVIIAILLVVIVIAGIKLQVKKYDNDNLPKWTGSQEDLEELKEGIETVLSKDFKIDENNADDRESWVVPKVSVTSGQITLTGGSRTVWLTRDKYSEEEIQSKIENLKFEETEVMPVFLKEKMEKVKKFRGCTHLDVSVIDFKIIVKVI